MVYCDLFEFYAIFYPAWVKALEMWWLCVLLYKFNQVRILEAADTCVVRHLHCAIGVHVVVTCKAWQVTASQFYLHSLNVIFSISTGWNLQYQDENRQIMFECAFLKWMNELSVGLMKYFHIYSQNFSTLLHHLICNPKHNCPHQICVKSAGLV